MTINISDSELKQLASKFHRPTASYLLSHSVGLSLTSTKAAIEEAFLEPWQQDPESVWPKWLEGIDRFQHALAKLFNSDKDLFCPQANLSSGFTKILQSLDVKPSKNVILLNKADFPSMGFVIQQAKHYGFDYRFLPLDMDIHDVEQWEQVFTNDVSFVLLSHVFSNTGQRLNIQKVCKLAKHNDVISVVDIAQSAGAIPIDFEQLNADFVLGSCVKWLCGGPGAGFLWVNENQLPHCKPIDVGWFSHENPFEFDIQSFRYHPSALRFWGGTPSVLPFHVAANSIEFFNELGSHHVYEINQSRVQFILDNVDSGYVVSPQEQDQRSGTVILHFKEKQEQLGQAFKEAGIQFDERQPGFRLSPHVYTTQQELQDLITTINTCL